MKTKHCAKCDQTLTVEYFSTAASRYDGLQTYCRECMKEHRRAHYHANKKPYLDRAKKQRQDLRKEIRALKDNKACMDCGNTFRYWCLEYDHPADSEKVGNVSTLASNGRPKAVLAEIEKCDLVCANCHRERTAQRNLWV